MQRPTAPVQFAVYTAQMRRLWERLAQADPLEADLLAMTTTDPLVLDAIATCPPVWRRPDKHSPQTLVPREAPSRVQSCDGRCRVESGAAGERRLAAITLITDAVLSAAPAVNAVPDDDEVAALTSETTEG